MNESQIMTYFREISAIPRASFQEKAIADYLEAFAKRLGLRYERDSIHNIIIYKDATPGYENAPVVMLQSHTDMVAEKNNDSTHNFDTDPLDLYIEDGFLKARGTTLGADDGAGVVYMMAILADENAKHPALECVFTVQEETGLTGADLLDTSNLKAEVLIGLDGSGEVETYISSCGGVRGALTRKVSYEMLNSKTLTLRVRGLLGGHSGAEIDQERGNASKIVGIILHKAMKKFDLRIVSAQGGNKLNAITREHDITIALEDVAGFKTWFEEVEKEFQIQYEFSDSGLNFILEEGSTDKVLSQNDTRILVDTLFMLPQGVIQMSKAIPGLVITSANIGTVDLKGDLLEVCVSLRATQGFVIETVMDQVSWIAKVGGFDVEYSSRYPGWNYDKNSKFRERTMAVYQELRGEAMKTEATHGGMELGIWKDRMPHIDIVSFGPIMYDIHTPQERLDIASFERTYEFMLALIASLNNY